ncbi:unnamed protein product [Heterobilharzia americana]|nr:unnamed protein product [Heterobilharzia americana]
MSIDHNFSRANGFLNNYLPYDSNANEISDDNQNKTLAPAINTGRRNGYEERGGSTEYVKESESMRPNLFPAGRTKNPSSLTDSSNYTGERSEKDYDNIGSVKSRSKIDSQSDLKPTSQSLDADISMSGMPADDTAIDSHNIEEYKGETEKNLYFQPFTMPDESASRDLDNASPRTVALCSRYPCHYCFFVYFPSSTVDDDIIPFQRKAFMDKVALLQNPEHIKEVKETKCARDAFSDRRIRSIERHSGTQVHLSELDPGVACVKGLPRRRLTIAGPTFVNICCALNLLEDLLPGVIKGAVFPYRLPEGSSTRFQAGSRMSSVYHWDYGKADGSVHLRTQLDDKGGWQSFLAPCKGNKVGKA